MADFKVRLSLDGVEFIPTSPAAWEWLRKSGKANNLAGPNNALLRDAASAHVLAEALYRKGLTWVDEEAEAGRKPLLPTPKELIERHTTVNAARVNSELRGIDNFFNSPQGCLLLLISPIIFIVVLFSAFFSGGKTENPPSPIETSESSDPAETDIVSQCDLAVRENLVDKDSNNSAWEWKYIRSGSTAEVMRDFESTNAFGGKVSSSYLCKFDSTSNRITFLATTGPYGAHILIDTPRAHTRHRKRHHAG